MDENDIKHTFTSTYHPSSNGGAERLVQTVKRGLKAIRIDKGDAELKLRNCLLSYRATPTITTVQTPGERFVVRRLRTRLDLTKPNLRDRMKLGNVNTEIASQSPLATIRQFVVGENVLVRNHLGNPKWLSGTILKQIGPLT